MAIRAASGAIGTVFERGAQECEAEARRLDEAIRSLEAEARAVFAGWRGQAAESLAESLQRQLRSVRVAQEHWREAARALRARGSA